MPQLLSLSSLSVWQEGLLSSCSIPFTPSGPKALSLKSSSVSLAPALINALPRHLWWKHTKKNILMFMPSYIKWEELEKTGGNSHQGCWDFRTQPSSEHITPVAPLQRYSEKKITWMTAAWEKHNVFVVLNHKILQNHRGEVCINVEFVYFIKKKMPCKHLFCFPHEVLL